MYKDTQFETELAAIDLMGPEPSDEHSRELYYIGKLRKLLHDRSEAAGRQLTACTVTFGCQMNARDSEKLIGILLKSGFAPTESENADFVIFNTCTVRDNADQRTFGHLGRISHLKKKNPQMKVAICGCMMQEKSNVEKVLKSYPFVDLIFGTHNIYRFAEYLWEVYDTDRKVTQIWDKSDEIVENLLLRNFRLAVEVLDQGVLDAQNLLDLGLQILLIGEKLIDLEAYFGIFIRIEGSNARLGGAKCFTA